ncbi:RNA-directed DNA polymerase, eukaryota [Tanacetum coccineum]
MRVKIIDDSMLPKTDVPTRWVKSIPIKINIFAWRVSLDKLPTRLNLSLRGLDIPSIICPLCSIVVESTSHLIFSCQLARQLMFKVVHWLDWVVMRSMSGFHATFTCYRDGVEWGENMSGDGMVWGEKERLLPHRRLLQTKPLKEFLELSPEWDNQYGTTLRFDTIRLVKTDAHSMDFGLRESKILHLRTKVTPDNVEKPTKTEIETPIMEVEKINEVENGAKLIKTSKNEEVVEAPGSQPVAYYLKHKINEN